MNWRVTVSNPMNTEILAEFENGHRTSDGEIGIRGFDPPIVAPPGRGKNLNLYVKQNVAEVPPRGIVQLTLDGQPVFWGPAIITPPLTAPGAGPYDQDRDSLERVTVAGGEWLLKESVVGPRIYQSEIDVCTVAFELCQLYAHPALTVDESNFPLSGGIINVWYKPEWPLYQTLEDLSKLLPGGASFWVDATGHIHFQSNGALT